MTTDNKAANAVQVGGNHYQLAIQPWDYIVSNGIGYLEGNIIKYVSRWTRKGGIQDLEKARHYLDKLIETEQQRQAAMQPEVKRQQYENIVAQQKQSAVTLADLVTPGRGFGGYQRP